jgi:hypothetical protein
MHTDKFKINVKGAILSGLLLVCSLALALNIAKFSTEQTVFSVSAQYSVLIILQLLVVSILILLSMGNWHERVQYILIPVPIAISLFITTLLQAPVLAPIVFIFSLVMLIGYAYSSTRLVNLLVSYDPRVILRPIVRGTMFVFSVFAAASVILGAVSIETVELTDLAVSTAAKTVPSFLDNQFAKTLLRAEISSVLRTYEQYLQPISAVLTFFVFQFFTWIAYLIFSVIAPIVHKAAIKTGFYRKETVNVEKEVISF